MRITDLRRSPRRDGWLALSIDDEHYTDVPEDIALARGLRAGDAIEEAALEALRADVARWRAREAALRLLAHSGRTRADLRRRLEARGHAPDVVTAVLDDLVEKRLVDDAAVAAAFVRERIRHRPRAPRLLRSELRRKGVVEPVAQAAIEEALAEGGVTELELARAAAARWRGGRNGSRLQPAGRGAAATSEEDVQADTPVVAPDTRSSPSRVRRSLARRRVGGTEVMERRLRDYLARRGFAADVIRRVVAEYRADQRNSVAPDE